MSRILQLGQELQWQVMKLQRAGLAPPAEFDALFPPEPDSAASDDERRQAVIMTADKIQRELLGTVRFDPLRLVGVGGPIDELLDSVVNLLVAIDGIRQDAASNPNGLPSAVRSFQGMLERYCDDGAPVAA